MQCDTGTCIYYALLTFLAVLAGTLALDVLGYIAWAYYVGVKYSRDLIAERTWELEKIG
jgi:hypothetical protein